jgi:hypothetical protein
MLTTEPRSETAQPTGSTALIAEIAALRAQRDDCRRCIVCQALCDEGDTCSPECESEYRTGIREQAADAVRDDLRAAMSDVIAASLRGWR